MQLAGNPIASFTDGSRSDGHRRAILPSLSFMRSQPSVTRSFGASFAAVRYNRLLLFAPLAERSGEVQQSKRDPGEKEEKSGRKVESSIDSPQQLFSTEADLKVILRSSHGEVSCDEEVWK